MRAFAGPGAVLVGAMLVAGCSGGATDASAGLPEDAVVSYAFHDSSVPPAYHRSEALTVTRTESHLIIDSYGDILADERVPTPTDVWEALGATLPSVTGLQVQPEADGCSGGTGMDLAVESGEETLVDLRVRFCGSENAALAEPIVEWIAPARAVFPPTAELAPEGEGA